ncbi:allophanate hydrolase [Thiocapsa roseopersicina]|uniref:Allophanate hydrolase n=1 Tax=Thiocapsa roseopersicina TaxID=1058 RepID=A0A1H2Q015_THIRO|nr:allophanate hydrolase [Thiocapsa roseopersicina]SDW00410.1 allophanate hydrolase [Thiocapsa roseopersicina]
MSRTPHSPLNLSIRHLRAAYREGGLTPATLVEQIRTRIAEHAADNIWIHVLSDAELAPYLASLSEADPETLPLYGIPFAIKDNIDLAGVPTTAALPELAWTPERSATVVERLISAGALPIGKTNLDQLATGLVGTRSPYGAVPNAFDPDYIAGGSSSGSAAAVAHGLVSFALGTDTAGSGRVPAALNNLVGIKPTRGLVSTRGVLPACRTLDCVSLFTLDLVDAGMLMPIAVGFDPEDPFARPAPSLTAASSADGRAEASFRFGVPADLEWFGDTASASLFEATVRRLSALGGEAVTVDFTPFVEAARLLYEGPWVAERYAAIEDWIRTRPETLHPVTRAIIEPAAEARAVDAFKAQYRLAEIKRRTDAFWPDLDCILTPTIATPYRIAEVAADPIRLNSNLGYYTNFMNLLDLAAVAVPAGMRPDGLPFGVTLFGPAFSDGILARLAERLHLDPSQTAWPTQGATGHPVSPGSIQQPRRPAENLQESEPEVLPLVVCGAHLSGLALNHQLIERGARLLCATKTAPCYRLYALPGGPPERPGLIRVPTGGVAIEVEVWALPQTTVGSFLAGIPAPLGLGSVELADGRWEKGFICEGFAAEGARDISALGGWRAYLGGDGG